MAMRSVAFARTWENRLIQTARLEKSASEARRGFGSTVLLTFWELRRRPWPSEMSSMLGSNGEAKSQLGLFLALHQLSLSSKQTAVYSVILGTAVSAMP
ncbi:hypothetical protein LZ32DRAFT_180849 [Colletotrichum eremochloae]|nr:hypothetical protein LZ32DRAFT_180849 [Colletotrichum eremochloae]